MWRDSNINQRTVHVAVVTTPGTLTRQINRERFFFPEPEHTETFHTKSEKCTSVCVDLFGAKFAAAVVEVKV